VFGGGLCSLSASSYLGDKLSVDGDADTAVETRIQIGWNKFTQLVPMLTNKDISLIVRGRLYNSCVQSSMLHGIETWPVWKENEVSLQQAEMRIFRWMCGINLQTECQVKGWERLGLDDIISVLQQNSLRCYGHVLQKENNDWVKKCMEYEVEGARPRGWPKKTWTEIVEKDCQARKLNKEDAMDRKGWSQQIWDDWWPWLVWVGECFVWYRLTWVVPDKVRRAVKWL